MGCALHPSQTSQEPTPCRYKTKARLISHSLFLREIAQGPSAAADSPHWTAPRSSAESSRNSRLVLKKYLSSIPTQWNSALQMTTWTPQMWPFSFRGKCDCSGAFRLRPHHLCRKFLAP